MKFLKIVYKNLKLLMRSKLSAFIIVFGPLLVMLLVGISFTNDSNDFNLNLGVYSPVKDEVIDSFIEKLNSENYIITTYSDKGLCKDAIKFENQHACIVFPENFSIENNRENIITVFVDQSKVNLVYLVLNTVSRSFLNRSSEISLDLTTSILKVHADNMEGIDRVRADLNSISTAEGSVDTETKSAISKLNGLDLSYDDASSESSGSIGPIIATIDKVDDDVLELVSEAYSAVEDIRDFDLDENESNAVDDFENIIDEFNSTIVDFNLQAHSDVDGFVELMEDFKDNIKDMSSKLQKTKDAKKDVVTRLNTILSEAKAISEKVSSARSTLDDMAASIDAIKVTEAKNIVNPITTKVEPVLKEQSNLNFMFPSLVVLLIMFTGLLLPALLVIIEKNSKAAFRVSITPTSDILFTFSNYLTGILLIGIQLFVILLVSSSYFDLNLNVAIKSIIYALIMISSFFILTGMLIGYLFSTEEMATLASVSIGSVFLLTSGLIFPLESMPRSMIAIARYNPFLIGAEIFKKTFLFSKVLSASNRNVFLMLIYSAIMLIAMIAIQKMSKIRFLHTKGTKARKEKERVMDLFKVDGKCALTIEGLIISLQEMSTDEVQENIDKGEVANWVKYILGDWRLSREILKLKKRKDIIDRLNKAINSKT